jgi:hypothetical protein
MMYGNLEDLKSLVSIEAAKENSQLFRTLEMASRQVDKITHRHFYAFEGAKYYDGGGSKLWLPDDILSVSSLKLDDGGGTYATTLATTDYVLYPSNTFPKIRLEISKYGDYSSFALGIQNGIEITGVFGYADSATPYESRTTLNGDILAGATSIIVADGQLVKTGETLRIGSEQMLVQEIVTNTVIVDRGVNGTTAAAHTSGAVVSSYIYPEDIVQATLIIAMRAYKRKDSAYQDVIGAPETGQIITSKGIDPDVKELLSPYRKQEYA